MDTIFKVFAIFSVLAVQSATASLLAQDDVSRDPTIVVAVPAHWPPTFSLDAQGRPQGFAIDIIETVAERANLSIRYRICATIDEAVDALRKGEAHVMPNLGVLPHRADEFDFTGPVETFALFIYVRSHTEGIDGFRDLKTRRVGVLRGNSGAVRFAGGDHFEPIFFEDIRPALFELLAGHIDALLYMKPVMQTLARDIGVESRLRRVGTPLLEVKRAIAVQKGDRTLLKRLDVAVSELLDSAEYRRIYVKWHGEVEPFWDVSRVLWAAGGALGVLVLGTALIRHRALIRYNRDLKRNIDERERAETKLKEILVDKEVLLREVHHRVKNNLQLVSSLLQLQLRKTDDPALATLIEDMTQRVATMGLVHENLYQSESLRYVDFHSYLENLSSGFQITHGGEGICIELRADDAFLSIEKAIPCGLIVNELITNSVQHAFPGRTGTIRIEYVKTEDGHVLSVQDDGIGFDIDTDHEPPRGLGLTLVRALAAQIDGEIDTNFRKGGASFMITFAEKGSMRDEHPPVAPST